MSHERDYVLGTNDEEIARLGMQHRVWRPRALDAWRRAGFTVGQTILDVGCGPGWAAIDLAGIVGKSGRVVSVDRSRRFLDALESERARRALMQIESHEIDLDTGELPEVDADGAWARWIFAFVNRPRDLLARVAERLKRGATIVLHEYFDYRTWRVSPRSPAIEEFVRVVMESWRESGGEPDVALDLPRWLAEMGFETRTLHPIVDVVAVTDFVCEWPKAFVDVGVRRLVELGHLSREQARAVAEAFLACEATPHSLLVTPAVLEIIAVRR